MIFVEPPKFRNIFILSTNETLKKIKALVDFTVRHIFITTSNDNTCATNRYILHTCSVINNIQVILINIMQSYIFFGEGQIKIIVVMQFSMFFIYQIADQRFNLIVNYHKNIVVINRIFHK